VFEAQPYAVSRRSCPRTPAMTVTGSVLIAVLATVAGIVIVGVGVASIKPLQGRLETALTKASSEAAGAKEQVKNNKESSA